LAATALGIFVIPVLFVLFESIALKLHDAPPRAMEPGGAEPHDVPGGAD